MLIVRKLKQLFTKKVGVQESSEHQFSALIGAGNKMFKEFDLEKERSQMWPE
jgi:hypothetical protein